MVVRDHCLPIGRPQRIHPSCTSCLTPLMLVHFHLPDEGPVADETSYQADVGCSLMSACRNMSCQLLVHSQPQRNLHVYLRPLSKPDV